MENINKALEFIKLNIDIACDISKKIKTIESDRFLVLLKIPDAFKVSSMTHTNGLKGGT